MCGWATSTVTWTSRARWLNTYHQLRLSQHKRWRNMYICIVRNVWDFRGFFILLFYAWVVVCLGLDPSLKKSSSTPSTHFFYFSAQCRTREKKSKCFESAIWVSWTLSTPVESAAAIDGVLPEFDQEIRPNSERNFSQSFPRLPSMQLRRVFLFKTQTDHSKTLLTQSW